MRSGSRLGIGSLILAGTALVLAFTAQHLESYRGLTSAHLLNWLDRQGYVKAPDPHRVVELRPSSLLPINDVTGIEFLWFNAFWFCGWALVLALVAEYKREDTLFLSAGLLVACMSIVFWNYAASLAVMCIVGVAISLLRRQPPNHSIERTSSSGLRPLPDAAHVKR
jgi:hypothetical protein